MTSTPARPAPTSSQYVYIFVRQDIPLEHQLVQTNHATWSMAARYGDDDVPNIVMCGVPDEAALRATCSLLSDCGIAHWSWTEPDEEMNLGFTAITTEPIVGARRRALAQYKLWKPNAPVAQLAERLTLTQSVAGSSPAGSTTM